VAAWLALASTASVGEVLVFEDFDHRAADDRLAFEFGPEWTATTGFFKVGTTPGLASSGSGYLEAPSLSGAGERQRYGWFDASTAFNHLAAGNDVLVETVRMFVPDVTESTYGGMRMFDQLGNSVATIGVDMLTHRTLTSATSDVGNVDVLLDAYNDLAFIADYGSGRVDYRFNGTLIGTSFMTAASMAAGFSDFDFYNNGFNAAAPVAFRYDDYRIEAVPEPETLALMALGLVGVAARTLRKRRK
jgi:hypothetical protein